MADRAGGKGKPGVPKEVFELDKDERWQARLDEARARREVALREKAAGKPQAPRPKPWEVDDEEGSPPPKIEPIIQDRGDDKIDFADRLETIRGAKKDAASSAPEAPPVSAPPPEPSRPVRARDETLKAPDARARPQPSLILPGAPDVADLAARYAATLDTSDPLEFEVLDEARVPAPATEAEIVPLARAPQSTVAPEPEPRKLSRAERRRGIRPLGMALGLLTFAALPLGTEAPPLETGPDMPQIDILGIQPALGVTWSLSNAPFQTRSGEWVPRPAPSPLATVPFTRSTRPVDTVALPPLPSVGDAPFFAWGGLTPIDPQTAPRLIAPAIAPGEVPRTTEAPLPPEPPVATTDETGAPELEGEVSAPARPANLVDEEQIAPTPPPEPPAPRPSIETVVEADPLRVTILAPSRVDRGFAEDIGSSVQNDGHELVRIRDVDFNISERNVRYFHDGDRNAAARLAERYDAELRDFTWFRPKPVDGTAELWLAGRAPSDNTSGRVRPSQEAGQTDVQGDFLGRVFERLGLGTELPDALPDDLRSVLPGQE